jgi:serine/threonine protein kinase
LSGLERSGKHLEGTFQFMSREQVINFKYPTPAMDVWAVIACLYYLLTFRYPREFNPGNDALLTVLQKRPISILKRNPKIPKSLATIIDKGLEDSDQLYFQTAQQLKNELQSLGL